MIEKFCFLSEANYPNYTRRLKEFNLKQYLQMDLDIPFYNYGQSGAGNQYIANMIAQANAVHKFAPDDLIMVCWTNVCREDKWHNGQWATPGNIYTQNIYSVLVIKFSL